MLKTLLLAMSRAPLVKRLALALPFTRTMVDRFVAGETVDEVLAATRALVADGLQVTVDFLGEDTTTAVHADRVTDTYIDLLERVAAAGLTDRVEVSIKLSALGARIGDGNAVALDNARVVCAAAARMGTTVTVDMEDHTTTESTLLIVAELRREYPWVGAVVQAMLYRTSEDCLALAGPGSRVRLCKGAYAEPRTVAHPSKAAVDRAYRRCATILLGGEGRPMFATHDPALIAHVQAEAARLGRSRDSYELQMLLGIRSDEQRRLAAAGETVRVYVPFGTDWYAYFMRRLAERPANLRFLLRALVEKKSKPPTAG
jgi:proline dehydrogenase